MYAAVSLVKLGITVRGGQVSRGGLETRNGKALLAFPASYGKSVAAYRNFCSRSLHPAPK